MSLHQIPSLSEVLPKYVTRLKEEERREGQQELSRFIQWFGRDRSAGDLNPPEIGEYAESAGMWGADSARKLKPVKSFLAYLKERGFTRVNLATHLKVPKTQRGARREYFKASAEHAELTPEGYANLQSRLEILKEERVKVVSDIQRAMADKDFKENAPLDAAKERQGLIEYRIREIEGVLTNASVAAERHKTISQRVRLGRTVTLKDVVSGKEVRYKLVDSRETDPVTGKDIQCLTGREGAARQVSG